MSGDISQRRSTDVKMKNKFNKFFSSHTLYNKTLHESIRSNSKQNVVKMPGILERNNMHNQMSKSTIISKGKQPDFDSSSVDPGPYHDYNEKETRVASNILIRCNPDEEDETVYESVE